MAHRCIGAPRLRLGCRVALFNTMVADTTPEPITLGDLLSSVARRATDGQLRSMTLIGVFGAAVIAGVLGRAGWLGAAGALAVGAYGAWGLADRALSRLWSRPGAHRGVVIAVSAVRAASAAVATLAAVALLATALLPIFGGLVR